MKGDPRKVERQGTKSDDHTTRGSNPAAVKGVDSAAASQPGTRIIFWRGAFLASAIAVSLLL